MLKSVHFENFKGLRDTTLPLGPFTLIVGPNGSGKSSALDAIEYAANRNSLDVNRCRSVGASPSDNVEFLFQVDEPDGGGDCIFTWNRDGVQRIVAHTPHRRDHPVLRKQVIDLLKQSRIFRFLPDEIAKPVQLVPDIELKSSGYGLAGVLDQIDDDDRDRFNDLNNELRQWLPEYERIRLHTVANGHKSFCLCTREGNHDIPAAELSDGTLFALALLTIAYLPEPPPLICLEDPDHGIHPRLLRNVKDAIYRLAYPEAAGESRAPIQVVATTHSPYFLDLFKEHPEEIVIAEKQGLDVQFRSLSEDSHLREILQGASLGDVWYSGILGGVPSAS